MLQEATNNRAHLNILRQARDTAFESAYATHNQIDFHTRLARIIEFLNNFRLNQGIHLQHDLSLLTLLGLLHLSINTLHHRIVQGKWRLQ